MDLPPDPAYTLDAISARAGVPMLCIEQSSERYNLPLSLLYAVLVVEGGKPGTASKNKNGSYDYGPAQINTIWLDDLAKRGITKSELQNDGCKNIDAAGWIMQQAIKSGKSMWEGMASYHNAKEPRNFTYRVLLYRALRKIGATNPIQRHDLIPSSSKE